MTSHQNISFPFGKPVTTLILCRNDDHRRKTIAALGIPARYELIGSPLPGAGFQKIIVLVGDDDAKKMDQYIRELHARLYVGGKIHVL